MDLEVRFFITGTDVLVAFVLIYRDLCHRDRCSGIQQPFFPFSFEARFTVR